MVRRLGLGKNNHLTYASLALNPRYVVTGVHEGTYYKAKHEASDYKLSSISLQICVSFFFCTEYQFYLNYLDRRACANSIGPNQMWQNSI